MEVKIIKGQAWIKDNALVQEQIIVTPSFIGETNVIALVPDIWEDLLSDSGKSKNNRAGFFYWEYKMSDLDTPDVEVTVKIECPPPAPGLFTAPYKISKHDTDYAIHWKTKLAEMKAREKNCSVVQKKELNFRGTSCVNSSGELVDVSGIRVVDNQVDDTSNLLRIF